MQTKICCRCKKRLPVTEFRKHGGEYSYSLQCYCKKCQYEINKTRWFKNSINSHIKRSDLPKECHDLTEEEYWVALSMQDARCNICGKLLIYEKGEIDCIIPLSKGGAVTFYNVQILCNICNSKKHAKIMECDLHLAKKFKFKERFTELDYKLIKMML